MKNYEVNALHFFHKQPEQRYDGLQLINVKNKKIKVWVAMFFKFVNCLIDVTFSPVVSLISTQWLVIIIAFSLDTFGKHTKNYKEDWADLG